MRQQVVTRAQTGIPRHRGGLLQAEHLTQRLLQPGDLSLLDHVTRRLLEIVRETRRGKNLGGASLAVRRAERLRDPGDGVGADARAVGNTQACLVVLALLRMAGAQEATTACTTRDSPDASACGSGR